MASVLTSSQLVSSDDLAMARATVAAAEIDVAAEPHREAVLAFVDAHPDALHRSCAEGHLTGSALVVDASGTRAVLMHHRKLARWLQPGGHADGEANLAAVALREAEEETGITGLRVVSPAVDIDVHRVEPPGEQSHLHLDVRFVVLAPADADLVGNHESTAVRWTDLDALVSDAVDDASDDAGLRRLARRGRDLAGALFG